MIERLLAAEAAFAEGDLDVAGRLYGQVADADPRNAIAVVGLARLALRDGRRDEAQALVERALAIDPDEAAALRLIRELAVSTIHGTSPGEAAIEARIEAPRAPAVEWPAALPAPATASPAPPAPPLVPELAPAPRRRSLLGRLRAWLARRGRSA